MSVNQPPLYEEIPGHTHDSTHQLAFNEIPDIPEIPELHAGISSYNGG